MKKGICMGNDTFAIYAFSAFDGIEFRSIEYGTEDYVYFEYFSPNGKTYHKCKIYYSNNGNDYIRFRGQRVYMRDCLKLFGI